MDSRLSCEKSNFPNYPPNTFLTDHIVTPILSIYKKRQTPLSDQIKAVAFLSLMKNVIIGDHRTFLQIGHKTTKQLFIHLFEKVYPT
jgi:hypothetical protein